MSTRLPLPVALPVFLALSHAQLAALDLTPRQSVRKLEQFNVPVVLFEDNGRTVRWQPPTGWQLNMAGRALTFFPPKSSVAIARLEVRPPGALAAVTGDAPLAWAQAHLPNSATEIALTAERENPFSLSGLGAKERIYSYRIGTQRLSTSVAYVDLSARESLALIVTALAADFDAIHTEAIASMFSWNWLERENR
jgi:hypothetical protein